MNEFTINVVQDPFTIININNLDQATSLQVSEEGPTSLNVQNNSSNVLIDPSAVDLSPYVTGEVVRPSETGAFYAASNPSGFITGVDLSFSGNYYTKSESESRYVNTTGTETILGDKTFHDRVYINNLYVTGLETIVNTTNTNVASNFIMLNLTGGAVDGGLFFVTGAGLTGINDSGAILGFDHSDKFKFGIGTRASDLSVLDTIASVEEMTGISGSLQTQISSLSNATGSYVLNSQTGAFYSVSNPSGFITGVDLSTYATITNLAATGSTLQTNINNLSGVYATISNLNSTGSSLDSKISLLSGSSVLLYGDQTISGIKTFTTGVNISGNLTVDTNTLFVDAANNKVGIGTSSSLIGKLDVAGSLTTTTPSDVLVLSRPYNPGVAFHTAASFRLSNPNTNVNNTRLDIALQQGNASSPVTPDTTVMTLLGNGRVGIGTATPNEKLHIYDSVDAHLKIAGADTAGSIRKLSLERSTGGGEIHFNEDTRTTQGLTLNTTNVAYPMSFQINGDTKMFVSTAGSVGIGTTSPSTPLHTYTAGNNSLTIEAGAGDSQVMLKSAGSLKFLFGYEDSDNGFRIYNYGTSATSLFAKSTNGYIGIGTVAPNERLTVSGNANISGNISANNLVYNTGNQTVSGIKNFQSVPLVSGEEVYYKKNVVYFTGDNFTPDANLARTFEYVLTGLAGASATLNAPINMNNGENIVIKIKQSPSGSNNIIFNSNYKFPGGVIPSLTFTPDKADIYTALKIDSNFYSTYIKDFIN